MDREENVDESSTYKHKHDKRANITYAKNAESNGPESLI